MPKFTEDYLNSLGRKELQLIAKEHGLKANRSNLLLIEELKTMELSEDSNEIKTLISEDIDTSKTLVKVDNCGDLIFAEYYDATKFISSLEIGLEIQVAFSEDKYEIATIKRINKKSARVANSFGIESTVLFCDMRPKTIDCAVNKSYSGNTDNVEFEYGISDIVAEVLEDVAKSEETVEIELELSSTDFVKAVLEDCEQLSRRNSRSSQLRNSISLNSDSEFDESQVIILGIFTVPHINFTANLNIYTHIICVILE